MKGIFLIERWRRVGFFVFFLLLLSLSLQPSDNSAASAPTKLRVVTTILPLQEFARAVCGERGEVDLLIPPGVEIHSWSPRPSDIHRLARADCLVYIGRHLEPWVKDITGSLSTSRLRLIEAAQVIDDSSGRFSSSGKAEAQADPHLWLDLELDQRIVDLLVRVFSELLPQEADYFRQNGTIYQHRLAELDQLYFQSLKDCQSRTFIVGGHAAYGFLARRYGLTQLALTGVNPEAQPSSRSFLKIVKRLKKEKVRVIFVEPFSSPRMAQTLARETGAEIIPLNPGVFLPPEEKTRPWPFLSIMKDNLEKLKYALGCR
ncbi:MAG: zinc ABC transporter substrate-binding protein [Candidatus Aminicenantes bacterium]|nr:zinc ABC transporter substrate-binding protein [Candidatus Aminicenantes bacterium]